MIYIKNININDRDDLLRFVNDAGDSLKTFRYFSTRPLSVIENHITTVLLYENEEPVGYGHLDRDGESIWLGICVKYDKKGNGYGKQLMSKLIGDAKNNSVNLIKLSVDTENTNAIQLYHKFGFKKNSEIKQGVLLMTLNMSEL